MGPFTYAQVEQALAAAFNVPADEQPKWFRARLKHLQRLGVPFDTKPGKGKRIAYSFQQVMQLAVCLELGEFGIDPTKVVPTVKISWESLFERMVYSDIDAISREILLMVSLQQGHLTFVDGTAEKFLEGKFLDEVEWVMEWERTGNPMPKTGPLLSHMFLQGGKDRISGFRRVAVTNLTVLGRAVLVALRKC